MPESLLDSSPEEHESSMAAERMVTLRRTERLPSTRTLAFLAHLS